MSGLEEAIAAQMRRGSRFIKTEEGAWKRLDSLSSLHARGVLSDFGLRGAHLYGADWHRIYNQASVRCTIYARDEFDVGVEIDSSGEKQDIQSRPGGKKGSRYKRHIWKNIKAGSIDVGNFKDKTDVNFPFGRLALVQIIGGEFASITTTDGGPKGIGSAWGVDRLEIKGVKVKGKLTNKVKVGP